MSVRSVYLQWYFDQRIGCGKSKNFAFLASQEDGLRVASSLTSRNRHGGDIYLPSHVLVSIDCRKISVRRKGTVVKWIGK